jgi:pimeloyl-ACP methyl ester carboxylesterase
LPIATTGCEATGHSIASRRRCALLIALICSGCGTFHSAHSFAPPTQAPEVAIFVADGAGNFQACSQALRDAASREKSPAFIHTFEWSHGYGRILSDQLDFEYAQNAGRTLARQLEEFQDSFPACRIYLLGHSAGSSVILAALESARPGLVERAFLIAPSVSARYDLTPALRNVKHSLHSYFSHHDWYYLGFATHVVGTQDRKWIEPASGRVGFRYQPNTLDEVALAVKLKQHPWKQADTQTGHIGGHFGAYQPEFLRRNVLPLTIPKADDHFLDAEDGLAERRDEESFLGDFMLRNGPYAGD